MTVYTESWEGTNATHLQIMKTQHEGNMVLASMSSGVSTRFHDWCRNFTIGIIVLRIRIRSHFPSIFKGIFSPNPYSSRWTKKSRFHPLFRPNWQISVALPDFARGFRQKRMALILAKESSHCGSMRSHNRCDTSLFMLDVTTGDLGSNPGLCLKLDNKLDWTRGYIPLRCVLARIPCIFGITIFSKS